MGNIFFTSDTHFNHKNIIKYCNRPFNSIEEMNKVLIENWNNKVKKFDTVYHLGDFCFGNLNDALYFRDKLNGNIFLIRGNHDKTACNKLYTYIYDIYELKKNNNSIIMCHYPMRYWNKSHYNSWHIYGHVHGTIKSFGKSYDIGVDNNNFTPVSYEELEIIMNKMPDNLDYILINK